MKFKHRTLTTRRLRLRRPYLTDVDDLYICTGNPNVCKYEGWHRHLSNIETVNFVNGLLNCYDEGYCYDFIIEEKASGRAIGVVNLHDINFSEDVGYIGYWLAEDVWGKGYGTEAVGAFVNFFFTKAGLKKMLALCHPANTASGKLLEKTGFRYIGDKPDTFFAGREDDSRTEKLLIYEISNTEFSSKDSH